MRADKEGLALCMIVKDASETIGRCLELLSLHRFDEAVDMFSQYIDDPDDAAEHMLVAEVLGGGGVGEGLDYLIEALGAADEDGFEWGAIENSTVKEHGDSIGGTRSAQEPVGPAGRMAHDVLHVEPIELDEQATSTN